MIISLSQSLVWRERASLPLPRTGYIGGVVDNRYVVAGGSYWVRDHKLWTSRVDIFDPHQNKWITATPLPEARGDAASVVVGNCLHAFGGLVGSHSRADALV